MRWLVVIGVLFVVGCGEGASEVHTVKTISLNSGLGQLTMAVPLEMDTFYTWMSTTDYRCGAKKKYRFGNTGYSLFQESGFIDTTRPDSLYQITISHTRDTDCEDIESIGQEQLDVAVSRLKANYSTSIFVVKKLEQINGRDFILIHRKVPPKELVFEELIAFTAINNQALEILCECYAADCSDFIEQATTSIHSVKIEEHQQ